LKDVEDSEDDASWVLFSTTFTNWRLRGEKDKLSGLSPWVAAFWADLIDCARTEEDGIYKRAWDLLRGVVHNRVGSRRACLHNRQAEGNTTAAVVDFIVW